MHPYPHRYTATAVAESTGRVTVSSRGCRVSRPTLLRNSEAPAGLVAGDSSLRSRRGLFHPDVPRRRPRGALRVQELECRVEGVLERVGSNSQFTRYTTIARLGVPPAADPAKARRLLEQAEQGCLIANSLRGTRALEIEIVAAEIGSTARETAQID